MASRLWEYLCSCHRNETWNNLGTYGGRFFNNQSALLFSSTCSFIRTRQTSYRSFSRKTNRSYSNPLISRSTIQMNNSKFGDFVDRIYLIELQIKDTTDTARSASYLDINLKIDSDVWVRTKPYDKGNDYNFRIVNLPFICNNISEVPAYRIYLSQLIRHSKTCGFCQDSMKEGSC